MNARRPFGHVGDPQRDLDELQKAPAFTQEQVDYLVKNFVMGAVCEPAGSLDDAVRVNSWTAALMGQHEIINHMQRIVNERSSRNRVTT